MTGAMYAAISGLKAHMQKLNVIGNNIANVNTYGYKAARTTFKESLYTTLTSGSNGTNSVGGVNPSQIGYGCSVGTIDLDMGSGTYMPTGNALDCMIDGDGFFLVGDKPAATDVDETTQTLTKTDPKNLELTRVGNFGIDPQGYLVDGQGRVVYGFVTRSTGNEPGAVDASNPDVSTQLVPIRLPLSSKTDGSAVFPGVGDDGQNVYDTGEGDSAKTTGETITAESISIDPGTGKISAINKADSKQLVIGYIPLANVTNPNGVTHIQGPYYRAGEGAGTCTVGSIGDALSGKYLDNPTDTTDAVAIRGTGGAALITSGLESSGTDLATEISEMITTQRGYQANTRIITVTDSMLEELVNMKR